MARDPRIQDELRFHRDRLIEDYVASGMTRADAERRAFLEFGNPAGIEEAVRDVRRRWLEDLQRDLRYAFRTLRRHRGFSALAVLSLALGIGVNTAIFSLLNALVLRPVQVTEPGQLVQFSYTFPGPGPNNWNSWMGYPHFERFRARTKTMSAVFGSVSQSRLNVSAGGSAGLAFADLVTGNYFTGLDLLPQHGRLIAESDDRVDGTVAVLSDGYWKRRFGGDPSVVGKSVDINRVPFTVIGIAPAGFSGMTVDSSVDLAADPHARSVFAGPRPLDGVLRQLDAHRRAAHAWSLPRPGPGRSRRHPPPTDRGTARSLRRTEQREHAALRP